MLSLFTRKLLELKFYPTTQLLEEGYGPGVEWSGGLFGILAWFRLQLLGRG